MANMQKYTRSQIGGLTRHYERGQKEDGSYYDFGNQEIDRSRIHLNYNLAPERAGGQLSFINKRTSEVQCLNRSDVNVMCSWVITAPKDLFVDEYALFFRESYAFLNQRYADADERNVISAYVHMDETQPHLHYAFVPVVHDQKKGIDKVSAKIAIDRVDLQTFHQDLEKHMAAVFGREIGILNEATKDGNQSIDELKRGTAQAEKEKIAKIVQNLRNTVDKHKQGIKVLENKKNRLEGQIRAIEGQIITQDGLDKLQVTPRKDFLGRETGDVIISKRIYEGLINAVIASPRIKDAREIKEAGEEISRLENRVNTLMNEKKHLQTEISNLQKQIPKKLKGFEAAQEDAITSALSKVPLKDRLEMLNAYNSKGKTKSISRSDFDFSL
ncbi:MAG: plasmid recombination protein [Defluviitaleaceae bacterium]|nr:plasmid recombination protein [Defluviitaleaceae bacterium]